MDEAGRYRSAPLKAPVDANGVKMGQYRSWPNALSAKGVVQYHTEKVL